MKKKILTALSAFALLLMAVTGCDSSADKTLYDGPEYVMFSDTLSYFPITGNDALLELPIGSTVACSYDRTYGIEIDDSKSTAVEDYHFTIESNSVTIKAGERAANVRLKGKFDNIRNGEKLSVVLKLISKKEHQWDLYGTTSKVELIRSCPFNIENFTGYCKVRSTFFSEYMLPTQYRIVKAEKGKDGNSVVIKDLFYKGYDIAIKFKTDDPLKPYVDMEEQVLGSTAEAFGTIHGNGKLMVMQASSYASYFNSCENFVMQYITVYVDGVGTVGTFVNVIEWISDAQAEQLK